MALAPGVQLGSYEIVSAGGMGEVYKARDTRLDRTVAIQGDVLVQRGTIHNWVNRGTEPCIIAFVLIDAHPVEIDARVLEAVG